MSENSRGATGPKKTEQISNLRCELVSGNDVSRLEGRLKTFIDSIIPDTLVVQNKATKDIIRIILWDWFNFITDHLTDSLSEKKKWYQENGTDKPSPRSN